VVKILKLLNPFVLTIWTIHKQLKEGRMKNEKFQKTYVSHDKFIEVRHFQDLPANIKEGDIIMLGALDRSDALGIL